VESELILLFIQTLNSPHSAPLRSLEDRNTVISGRLHPNDLRGTSVRPGNMSGRLLEQTRISLCIGRWELVGKWEPDELRGSRPVLRGAGAEMPRPTHRKLKGPQKWTHYHLYVILDVFSRYVVGWMVAHRESAELAQQLIEETCQRQGISSDQLTLHADRGSSMTSKSVALLLSDLGVTKSHSRPYVSDDNPYSESQFKTLKYRPGFPKRFGCIEDARAFLNEFFRWYNNEHRHGGIGMMTPHHMHMGTAKEVRDERAKVLNTAYEMHPERFVRRAPAPPRLPLAAWINKPKSCSEAATPSPQGKVEVLTSQACLGSHGDQSPQTPSEKSDPPRVSPLRASPNPAPGPHRPADGLCSEADLVH
jgi:hypothetical protein